MATVELLTPFGPVSDVVELSESGGIYRKQILPFRTINYTAPDGSTRKIVFDRKYGEDLVQAFKDGAYDQVPFQLAGPDNRHNNDPRNTGGELIGVELSADGSGVDGLLRLWGDGAKVIQNNHKLGVSARIIENLTHSDGRTYPRAIQHVLGTVDPQATRMRPWEKVELSNQADQQVDLSEQEYGRGGMTATQNKEGSESAEQLTQDELARLRRILAEDDGLADLAGELEKLGVDLNEEDPDNDEDTEDTEDEGVELSGASSEAVELANAQIESQGTAIVELTRQLNLSRLEAEEAKWAREGLAPAVLEAVRPLLAVPTGAVELSNATGENLDPGEVVRDLLETVVDLARSGHLLVDVDDELGSTKETDAVQSRRQALVADWESQG